MPRQPMSLFPGHEATIHSFLKDRGLDVAQALLAASACNMCLSVAFVGVVLAQHDGRMSVVLLDLLERLVDELQALLLVRQW